jgi:putative resolvase
VKESMQETATSSKQETGKIAIYTRLSAAGNKKILESQAQRLLGYSAAKGYQVAVVVNEIGSGFK